MRPTLRKFTAEFPQINAYVQVRLTGSGQLQQDMEQFEPGSFGVMMSGLKSDVISFVHGDFRRKFMEFYSQQGAPVAEESSVQAGMRVGDSVVNFEVFVGLTFGRQLPGETRQDAATVLAGTCLQFASANAARAREIIASANVLSGHTCSEGQQIVNLPPEVMQQLMQQGSQGGHALAPVLTQLSNSPDTMPGPGQYL
jgi:hypothetical protein